MGGYRRLNCVCLTPGFSRGAFLHSSRTRRRLQAAVSQTPTVQNMPVANARVAIEGQKRRDYMRNYMRQKRDNRNGGNA